MQNLYYKPSGKTSPISLLFLLIAIAIGAPIIAFIYSYAILYIPLIYLNILCLFGAAFGIGFVANFVVGMGKVRNKTVAMIFGLIVGLAGLYVSWVVWIYDHANASAFVEVSYMDLLTNPKALWGIIWEINVHGTWGIGRSGGAVDGIMLTIVWIIEALAIVGVSVFFAYSKACEPYLENDDDWAETTKIGPFELIEDITSLKQELETQKYEQLHALPKEEAGRTKSYTSLLLYHGQKKEQAKEFYLTVNNMMEDYDKDGKLSFDEKTQISFIRISKEAGQQLFARKNTMLPAGATEE
ncbi:hypothetical protein [Kordia sp.]|uniref:hypothetical protein n=1 Tax=Kordia sp. TaxID=1965332 RepID=UPI003B599DC0